MHATHDTSALVCVPQAYPHTPSEELTARHCWRLEAIPARWINKRSHICRINRAHHMCSCACYIFSDLCASVLFRECNKYNSWGIELLKDQYRNSADWQGYSLLVTDAKDLCTYLVVPVSSFSNRLMEKLDDVLAHLLGLLKIDCMPSVFYDNQSGIPLQMPVYLSSDQHYRNNFHGDDGKVNFMSLKGFQR